MYRYTLSRSALERVRPAWTRNASLHQISVSGVGFVQVTFCVLVCQKYGLELFFTSCMCANW